MKKQPIEVEAAENVCTSDFADTDAYDRRIKRFVPYYSEMIEGVLSCLPEKESDIAALELGCGSGNLTKKMLKEYPCAKLLAIDLTEQMVEKCRRNLLHYSKRIRVVRADMISFCQKNRFDYALSNLALHYPGTDEKKMTVCENVWRSLKPGGLFSFSVMLNGKSPAVTKRIWKCWEQDVLQAGVTQEELDEWYGTNHASDHPVPPNKWLEWLKKLGFTNCEFVWNKTIFGIFRVMKPL